MTGRNMSFAGALSTTAVLTNPFVYLVLLPDRTRETCVWVVGIGFRKDFADAIILVRDKSLLYMFFYLECPSLVL